jgi:ATP-dependent Clp protease protease subunit
MVADQANVVSLDERLLASRVVVLGEEVDDAIANRLCAQLLYLESLSATEDIWLYVNSPGGSVTAGMAVYDTMQFIEPDVATVCMGLAASMGQFLLCAGAKGKRFSLPHTRILMHQPSGGVRGTAIDIAGQAENMRHTKNVVAERIALHTEQPVSRILQDWDRDRWFTPEEAKAYGMIDQVISRRSDLGTRLDAA